MCVVSLTVPTSNHNREIIQKFSRGVVSLTVPTSNHNLQAQVKNINALYLLLFLHQTTTRTAGYSSTLSCISYCSYIKPQPYRKGKTRSHVVSLTVPTSNHNWPAAARHPVSVVSLTVPTSNHNILCEPVLPADVVSLTVPTSNHNWWTVTLCPWIVVSLTVPTSNHNHREQIMSGHLLYLLLFLHQTTT